MLHFINMHLRDIIRTNAIIIYNNVLLSVISFSQLLKENNNMTNILWRIHELESK